MYQGKYLKKILLNSVYKRDDGSGHYLTVGFCKTENHHQETVMGVCVCPVRYKKDEFGHYLEVTKEDQQEPVIHTGAKFMDNFVHHQDYRERPARVKIVDPDNFNDRNYLSQEDVIG